METLNILNLSRSDEKNFIKGVTELQRIYGLPRVGFIIDLFSIPYIPDFYVERKGVDVYDLMAEVVLRNCGTVGMFVRVFHLLPKSTRFEFIKRVEYLGGLSQKGA